MSYTVTTESSSLPEITATGSAVTFSNVLPSVPHPNSLAPPLLTSLVCVYDSRKKEITVHTDAAASSVMHPLFATVPSYEPKMSDSAALTQRAQTQQLVASFGSVKKKKTLEAKAANRVELRNVVQGHAISDALEGLEQTALNTALVKSAAGSLGEVGSLGGAGGGGSGTSPEELAAIQVSGEERRGAERVERATGVQKKTVDGVRTSTSFGDSHAVSLHTCFLCARFARSRTTLPVTLTSTDNTRRLG
jgi:hypothetical protein